MHEWFLIIIIIIIIIIGAHGSVSPPPSLMDLVAPHMDLVAPCVFRSFQCLFTRKMRPPYTPSRQKGRKPQLWKREPCARIIWQAPEDLLVQYLQKIGLLKALKECPDCKHKGIRLKRNKKKDVVMYKCAKCKRSQSVRNGSLFRQSGLSLKALIVLTKCFLNGEGAGAACKDIEITRQLFVGSSFWDQWSRNIWKMPKKKLGETAL